MKRDYPTWIIFIIVLALGFPPAPTQSKTLSVGMCAGGTRTIMLPADPFAPTGDDEGNGCQKACHAGQDRRKRSTNGILEPGC
jgi:hypothetical protein